MKIIVSKTLPHRENGSPAGTSTGGPRTTPRRGSRPLTSGRWPLLGVSPLTSARASAPAACFPPCQRPEHGHGSMAPSPGDWPGRPPLAQGEIGGAGRTGFEPVREGRRHGSGRVTTPSAASQETRLVPPLVLPSAGHQRRHEVDPRGSYQAGTPSPRSRRCYRRHHRRHPRWGILL